MTKVLERYEENGLGLPYPIVLINGAEVETDEATGEEHVHIPDMEQLIAAVALTRILHPWKLDGREVRFIRRAIGMQAKEFAETLGLDPATFSRWENNKFEAGGWADKQVRAYTALLLQKRAPFVRVDEDVLVRQKILKRPEGEWPVIQIIRTNTPKLSAVERETARPASPALHWEAPELKAA